MAEPAFRGPEALATGIRITIGGEETVPDRGGAVVALEHTGYVDFLPARPAVHRRRLRFMFLVKRAGTIPVDRRAGTRRVRAGGSPR